MWGGVMGSERYRKHLESRLKDEIGQVEIRVCAIGAPKGLEQRSLIARYGKLLLLSQRLLDTLPGIEFRLRQRDVGGIMGSKLSATLGDERHRPVLRRFS